MSAPKPIEQREARRLRRELGLPMKEIAARLSVSVASVHAWTRAIELSEEHRRRNARNGRQVAAKKWIEWNRERRRAFQDEGRQQARREDPFHQAGCMLYWAEGAKGRSSLDFCNSDRAMVAFFWHFLRTYFEVEPERVRVSLNVYLNNGLALDDVVAEWRRMLDLPVPCFRNHTIDHYPTSSSGRRRNRLAYGVCSLRVCDTRIVQHIYGAIQEYAAFDEPRWLDGPPRRRRP